MSSTPAIYLHFAHANGFPSGTYRKLFAALPANYNVLAIEKFGHSRQFPVSNNWPNQADEMNHFIDSQLDDNHKVFAIGHSFGAVVSYLACCRNPQRFAGLIMLDPPLATGIGRHIAAVLKRTPLIDKFSPAGLAKTRNRRWHKSVDLVDYFAGKGLFRGVDRDCIADYVNSVIDLHNDEQVLNFDPNIEAELFRTVPHNLHKYTGHLACPATIVTGDKTDVCVPFLRRAFIRQNKLSHVVTPGGHLFPLEDPLGTAKLIVSLIEEQTANQSDLPSIKQA